MYYFTVNYSTIYYSSTTPAVLHLGKPTCAGFTAHLLFLLFQYCTKAVLQSRKTDLRPVSRFHLLFYYFTSPVLYKSRFASRKPTCAGSRFPYYFYYFTILLLFQYCTVLLCTILLLTIPLFTISTTTPAVCISETDLRRFTVHLLFYYFTIFTIFTIFIIFTIVTKPFASRKPTCAGSRLFYYFTIFTITPVLFSILLCTILLLTIPLFTILPQP